MDLPELPVVVIGGGPVGLAAAASLRERGQAHLVLEGGTRSAAGVRSWGHVRLFSPWGQLVDPAARRLLAPTGWQEPAADTYPTGQEWVTGYLQPLADALGDVVLTDHRVVGVTRRGRDRMVDAGRAEEPLVVSVVTPEGPARFLARAVIDASGTTSSPNPLGADGRPAVGEEAAGNRIERAIPDLTDAAVRGRFAGVHTVVVGAGHSAMTAVLALAELAEQVPDTLVTWAVRGVLNPTRIGGGEADELPRRGALGMAAEAAVASGTVTVVQGFRTAAVQARTPDGELALVDDDGRAIERVDRVVALTGYRPDLSLHTEVRLDLDPVTQAPRALGPLIDPNVHSCGTVPPHGEAELRQPEPGLYLAGMKSYGRAPTFLALTGFEQVRSIVAALTGDAEAAGRVELSLPETGVCSGSGVAAGLPVIEGVGGGGCC